MHACIKYYRVKTKVRYIVYVQDCKVAYFFKYFSFCRIYLKQDYLGSTTKHSSLTNSDANNKLTETVPKFEHISRHSSEDNDLEKLNDFDHNERMPSVQNQKPHNLQNKATVTASFGSKLCRNQQTPNCNPKDQRLEKKSLIVDDSSEFGARQENEMLTLDVFDKERDTKFEQNNNNLEAKFYDEDESKYLHVIDPDIQEPTSIIRSFDDSDKTGISIGKKRSDEFGDGDKYLNSSIQENDANFQHDYNLPRQLPRVDNPSRLYGKQTKLKVNIPSYNEVARAKVQQVKFEGDLYKTKQAGNKVKNLINDYELHFATENNRGDEFKEKNGDQFEDISIKDIAKSPNAQRRDTGSAKRVQSYTSSPILGGSSLIESSKCHEQEMEPGGINLSSPKFNNTECHKSMKQQFLRRDAGDCNERLCPQILGTKSSSSRTKENITNDISDCSLEKLTSSPVNKHKQSSLLDSRTSRSEKFRDVPITKVNSAGHPYSHSGSVRKGFTIDSNIDKQPSQFGKEDETITTSQNQSPGHYTKELRNGSQFPEYKGGSQVTRAHWYDIHGPLQKSSQEMTSGVAEGITSTLQPKVEKTFKPPPSLIVKNERRENKNFKGKQHKKWKSLGELDKIDQAEEYKLPDELNKTTTNATKRRTLSPKINNANMYLNTIPRNRENDPKLNSVQNDQRFNLCNDRNNTQTLQHNANAVNQWPLFSNANGSYHVLNGYNIESCRSSLENNGILTQKFTNGEVAKYSPSLARKQYVPKSSAAHNSEFHTNSTNALSPDYKYNKGNPHPSLENKNHFLAMHHTTREKNNSDHDFLIDSKSLKNPPLPNTKLKKSTQQVNYNTKYSASDDNLSSSVTDVRTIDHSPVPRSPSFESMYGSAAEEVSNSSDAQLLHPNHFKDYNKNLSSSLTDLDRLDQSPLKRSPKIRNLLNIEYYDINSDEELNNKIKRRPRTKSLNQEERTMEYVVPKREFKSSGDLSIAGFKYDGINSERKEKEKDRVVPFSLSQTDGKYSQLYADSIAREKHTQGKMSGDNARDRSKTHKPCPSINVSSYENNTDEDSSLEDDHPVSSGHQRNLPEYQPGENPLVPNASEKCRVQKVSHVRSVNTNPKQNDSRKKKLPHHEPNSSKTDNTTNRSRKHVGMKTRIKRLTSPSRDFASRTENFMKKDVRDTVPKSIVYTNENCSESQGKYNIAKAEKEWKKKYGKLPYNDKDPLHQSSDKEFVRLFQHAESKITETQSSSKQTDVAVNKFSLRETAGDTSSSSLFRPNKSDSESTYSTKSQSNAFSTTLNQLSSYVLSGYKDEMNETSPLGDQKDTTERNAVKFKTSYLDDEGDLSPILDDPAESPKLSMLVHTLIRLREVYCIQPYTKSQISTYPINLGNPQLRDAIENKPMSVLKDLILANRSVDINTRSQTGNSALHRAAIEGDIDGIRIVINHGANINISDRYGYQPIHQAMRHHHYKAAIYLMDCGTDLMSYTSKRIQEFVNVKAISRQYLRQTLKTPL